MGRVAELIHPLVLVEAAIDLSHVLAPDAFLAYAENKSHRYGAAIFNATVTGSAVSSTVPRSDFRQLETLARG